MINPFAKNHPISNDPLLAAEKKIEFYKGSRCALQTLEDSITKLALRLFVIAISVVIVSFFTQHRFFLFVDGILWGIVLALYLIAYKLRKDIVTEDVTLEGYLEHTERLRCEKHEIAYIPADN